MGDHTETVQVDYDPERITYQQLLELFWKSHDPTKQAWSRQYMNAIFYHSEEQQQAAMESKASMQSHSHLKFKTEVVPLRSFTMAEGYHQKYILKRYQDLNSEMERIYPDHGDFVDSTAVARLNGYVGGNGSKEQLSREVDRLGLSIEGEAALKRMVRR
jgi:hypothetical protein